MAIEGQVRHADELFSIEGKLRQRVDMNRLTHEIETQTEEALSKFRHAGLDLSTAEMKARIREQLSTQIDGEIQTGLLQLDADRRATTAALEQRLAESRLPARKEDPAAELLWLRKLEGRSLREVAQLYERTNDPILQRLVEEERDILRLRTAEDDATVMAQLQQAIRAKQDSREDPRVKAQLAQIRAGSGLMLLENLIHRAKDTRTPFNLAGLRRTGGN